VRWNLNPDTPLPPEEPAAKNPPDGGMIDYYLKSTASGPVTLEILNGKNHLVRRYSSSDKPEPVAEKELDIPTHWVRPTPILSADAGPHRFIWDLHYPPPPGQTRTYPISAIIHDTPSEPRGPLVLPGTYTIRLTVDSQIYAQSLTVKMDPRVKISAKDLEQQFSLSMECFQGMQAIYEANEKVRKLQAQMKKLREQLAKTNNVKDAKASPPGSSDSPLSQTIEKLDESLAGLMGNDRPRRGGRRRIKPNKVSLSSTSTELNTLLEILQGADATPTTQAMAACAEAKKNLADLMSRCKELQTKDMKSLNDLIRQTNMTGRHHLTEIKLGAEIP